MRKIYILRTGILKCDHFFESLEASLLYGLIIRPNYLFVNKQTSTNHTQNALIIPLRKKAVVMP